MTGETTGRDYHATVAAAFVGVQVGAATVASRYVLTETDPLTLGAVRYAIGVLILLPVLMLTPRVRFERVDIVPMALIGLLQFAVLIALFNWALLYAPAARVALVFATFPLLTMFFARVLGREQLTVWKVAGLLTTFAGVGVVLGDSAFVAAQAGRFRGDLFAFGAAVCGALCSVLYRPYVTRYSPLAVGVFAMTASAFALGAAALLTGGLFDIHRLSARGWAATIFVGLSSGFGFWALLWAYRRIAPTRVAVFQALAPVVASALGVTLLGETLDSRFLLGLAIVCCGIAIAHRNVRAQ